MLTLYAPAKVNLVLEVLGRENDYHRISTIMQSISLCDILNFEASEEICFQCSQPALESGNIVMKAVALLREKTGCSKGAHIKLHKHIPWGMGLGGGSSDAAATLLALNYLWGLKLPLSQLAHWGVNLGSDVPFFIYSGTALVEGRGEKVTPLPSLPLTWFVLLIPPLPKLSEKTRQMYRQLNSSHFTKGQFVQMALSSLTQGQALVPSLIFNIFEQVAFNFFPQLNKYRQILEEIGAPSVHLAGSGPCLFTFFPKEEEARDFCSKLRKRGLECCVACPFP